MLYQRSFADIGDLAICTPTLNPKLGQALDIAQTLALGFWDIGFGAKFPNTCTRTQA